MNSNAAMAADVYRDPHLFANFLTGAVELDGKPMKLSNKDFKLLAYLLRRPGELVTRETLLMTIWGYGKDMRTRTLDVHIRRLRQMLEPYGKVYIETVFATGYRFQPYARKRSEPALLGTEAAPNSWHGSESGN